MVGGRVGALSVGEEQVVMVEGGREEASYSRHVVVLIYKVIGRSAPLGRTASAGHVWKGYWWVVV